MIPLNDIKQLIDVYGKDILADPRRVHAILIDWHPRQKVSFDEVQDICRKCQKGQIKLPTSDNPIGNLSTGNPSAFATILGKVKSLIIHNGKLSASNGKASVSNSRASANNNKASINSNIIEIVIDNDSTTRGRSTGAARKPATTKPTNPRPAKPIKPTINTNPIDIKIDTSKSFRGDFR